MLDIPMFWLGRLGGLVPLACPEPGLSNALDRQAAETTTLSGRMVSDLQGTSRTWSLKQAYVDPEEVAMLEAMLTGVVAPPLRIIDPLKKNRLRAAVSAGTTRSNVTGGYHAFSSSGGLISTPGGEGAQYVEYTTEGEHRDIRYRSTDFVRWAVSEPNTLRMNGELNAENKHHPNLVDAVLPGEQLTLTFTVRSQATGFSVGYELVSNTYDVQSTVLSDVQGDGTWETISMTFTVPSNGTVLGIAPIVRTTATASEQIDISYAQLEAGDTSTQWEIGAGTPECVIHRMGAVSPRYPLSTVDLTIREL